MICEAENCSEDNPINPAVLTRIESW
jgi:hypothetical protein